MANAKRLIDPCEICELYVKGEACKQTNCPVAKLKAENERLNDENRKLRNVMSYMHNPNAIGDRHEMGCW